MSPSALFAARFAFLAFAHLLEAFLAADSAFGCALDEFRPNAWRYRDYAIRAFNADVPFDRFVVEQIAGDHLPNATLDQRIATGFHRNTMINEEGGTRLTAVMEAQPVGFMRIFERAMARTMRRSSVACLYCAGCQTVERMVQRR